MMMRAMRLRTAKRKMKMTQIAMKMIMSNLAIGKLINKLENHSPHQSMMMKMEMMSQKSERISLKMIIMI